jgi:O-succinylbenzoic acid--CoA ligase
MLGGAAVVIPEAGESLEDAIESHGVTHVSLVATQLFRMLQTKSGVAALRKAKAILLGGSAMPPALIRQAHELGLPILASYGLTEMASQVTTTRLGDPLDALLSSGRPLIPGSVTISPNREVLVQGRTLVRGYVHGARFDLPLAPGGWFVTDDIGRFDDDGNLHIIGRRDNMFTSGGENIQPEEIERRLGEVEGVTQALVVPVSCSEFGARPVAFIHTDGIHPIDSDTLSAHLKAALPSYKVPIQFLPWPEEGAETSSKLNRGLFSDLAERLRRPVLPSPGTGEER